jgi:outer membrane lipoprotein SlyB
MQVREGGGAPMKARRLASLLCLVPLLGAACVTTTRRTTTWGGYAGYTERTGHVEWIRETVERREGQPAAGAFAGAVIGGLLGSAIGGGYRHHHASAAGAVAGAVGGAMVGAAASQGSSEERSCEVTVRFDDGGAETFVYPEYAPFRVGDAVRVTPQGLAPM